MLIAFSSEYDEFWKFELLSILLYYVDEESGKKALTQYRKTYKLSKEQDELINNIIRQKNILDLLNKIVTQKDNETEPDRENNILNFLQEIIDYLEQNTDFTNQDPKIRFAQFGQLFNSINQGGIRYDKILDDITKLEERIGEIQTFAVGEFLHEEEQNKRYDYLLSELLYNSINSLKIIYSKFIEDFLALDLNDSTLNKIHPLIKNPFNENLVTRY